MARERIGKLERWILIHAYLKLKDKLPENWKEANGANIPYIKESAYKGQKVVGLRRDEVFLNYFNISLLNEKPKFKVVKGGIYYYDSNRYKRKYDIFLNDAKCKTAYASYGRTLKRMIKKGLIKVLGYSWYTGEIEEDKEYFYGTHGITLTEAGKTIAEKHLIVNGRQICPALTLRDKQ